MKAYLITTATVFGLITALHLWRMFQENPNLARDPFFLLLTLLAAGLCAWGCGLLRGLGRRA